MAAKAEVKDVAIKPEGGALTTDFFAELAAESSGAGVSSSADDTIVPFIALLQDMSPEAKKRDPKYVEGAEPGFLLNKASRQLWGPDDNLTVIPCAFQRVINEWVPRDDGGGFVGRHPLPRDGNLEAGMSSIGAKQVKDPKDPEKSVWVTADGRHQLTDTRYHYVLVENPDGRLIPAVLSFSSTGHTTSRSWMSLMNEPIPGSTVKPDSWMRRYRVRAVPKKNKKGDFFVLQVDAIPGKEGYVLDKSNREFARKFHESIMSGAVRAADEEGHGEDRPAPNGDASGI